MFLKKIYYKTLLILIDRVIYELDILCRFDLMSKFIKLYDKYYEKMNREQLLDLI